MWKIAEVATKTCHKLSRWLWTTERFTRKMGFVESVARLDKYSNCILRRWHLSTGMRMYHKHRYRATLYHWRNNSRGVREKCEPKLVDNFGVQSKLLKSTLSTQWKVFQHAFWHWTYLLPFSQPSDQEQIPIIYNGIHSALRMKHSSQLRSIWYELRTCRVLQYFVDPHLKSNYSWWAALIRTLFVLF